MKHVTRVVTRDDVTRVVRYEQLPGEDYVGPDQVNIYSITQPDATLIFTPLVRLKNDDVSCSDNRCYHLNTRWYDTGQPYPLDGLRG